MYQTFFDQISPYTTRTLRIQDPNYLESMLGAWENWHRDVKLGEPKDLHECAAGRNDVGVDPRRYDWLKGEESREVAKASRRGLFS